ncbi:tRNA lysidine(34) synthetase TilS [Ilyomonas limi]|uniref:tRNA(Ile)-lysidine synthase n=1 Tax=Ilyomonas limi TaxID=2575867 RepID=A0A4U3L684_9BACT|nr:tRNA lysidine(34) synthetase TilS [Ilyomonas limi]TKK69909.1 tRNA lysidine(34) synthetase TilS [Ilyomonas limi]
MLLQQFQAYWKEHFNQLTTANCHLLLAVSGGIDSVVLTDLVYKSGFHFTIAHCNFKLRGEESERDEAFVNALAQHYNKAIVVQHFNTKEYAVEHKIAIQEAARKLRYDWFEELIKKDDSWKMTDGSVEVSFVNHQPSTVNCGIVTAHHANDNIETLLINFFRGTGISGLHGILPKQKNILRPLLFAKREAIQQYALDNGLNWAEDSSNASDKYTRNFFRQHIIPATKEVYANVEDNLLQNIQRFGEVEMLYNEAIALHKKKLLEAKGNEVHIPVLKLQKSEPLNTIIWEIIKDFHFAAAQIAEVKKLLGAENGKYVASPTHRIIKNRNWLIIAPLQTDVAAYILIEKEDKEVVYEDGMLSFKKLSSVNAHLSTSSSVATLDAAHIHYPLLLRKWKPGDYFYPLGMKKKKKLSKFFIDLKLSKTDKEKIWVLEMNKKIIWVIGYRIDDRFKITPGATTVLLIQKH